MKRDEKTALREKTVDQLQSELAELQKQLAAIRLAVRAGKESNVARPKQLSDDIARIKTIIRLKQKEENMVQSQSGKKEDKE